MDRSWISGLSSFPGLQIPSTQITAIPSNEPSVQTGPSSTSGNGQQHTQLDQWAIHEGFRLEISLEDEMDPSPASSVVTQFASKMVEVGHIASQSIIQKGNEAGWLPERTQFMADKAAKQASIQLMAASPLSPGEKLQAYALALHA